MSGISTRNFKMFRQLCGESTLKNVVIVTNMWGEVSKEVGEARELELASQDIFFKPVLEKGAQLLRHQNTQESGGKILRHLIENHPLSLRIQRELVEEGKEISQTAAGAELNRELLEQVEKHRREMRLLQEEMRGKSNLFTINGSPEMTCYRKRIEAIRTKDEETRKELEQETRKLQLEMTRVQNDSQKLASDYNEEKERLERRMQELSVSARQETERQAAEYQRQIQELQHRLSQTVTVSAVEKNDIMRQLADLQRRREQGIREGLFVMIGRALDTVFGL